eukprot:TRINITY_DN137_c0_g1_i1.p1 TRINITY_DN137_c0_g1~~TRINITY_DN137_c0_g1_i1.p1  ORF type:complete len:214 (+),score=66.95 TRINITY_DN137_c0_g1_i1:67-642(+)
MLENFKIVELWGDNASCSIPTRFIDLSDIRQIPDNQEVFCDLDTDQSIIFELLEMIEQSNQEAAIYHFNEVASINEATNESIIIHQSELTQTELPNFDITQLKYFVFGKQKVTKFSEGQDAKNIVNVYMCLIRLKNVQTDLVISLNQPVLISAESSSRANVTATNLENDQIFEVFKKIIFSFKINNWDLFE